MSHFTCIKTQIKNVHALLKALKNVGFNKVDHDTAQYLYGYQGDVREQTAEVIIRHASLTGSRATPPTRL